MPQKNSSTKTAKAIVAEIQYAGFRFPGLQLPDGSYGITASQAWDILKFSDLPKNASRDIKRLLGNDFQTFRYASELNPKKVNIILLSDFGLLVLKLAFKGNEVAQLIAESSVTTTLEQAFDIAFNNKRSLEEYQERLKARVAGKASRRKLTDAIADYIESHNDLSENYRKYIYINCSDCINRYILGYPAKKVREILQIPESELIRDRLSVSQVRELDRVETQSQRIIDDDAVEPYQAVLQAIAECRTKRLYIVPEGILVSNNNVV